MTPDRILLLAWVVALVLGYVQLGRLTRRNRELREKNEALRVRYAEVCRDIMEGHGASARWSILRQHCIEEMGLTFEPSDDQLSEWLLAELKGVQKEKRRLG